MADMKTLTIGKQTFDVVDGNAVHFAEQTLTEEQKEQARKNIGAAAENIMVVTLNEDDEIASHGSEEMHDHVSNGGTVHLEHGNGIYKLIYVGDSGGSCMAVFMGEAVESGSVDIINIGDDGSYGMSRVLTTRSIMYVGVNSNGTTATQRAGAIFNHVLFGGTVYLIYNNTRVALSNCSPSEAVFIGANVTIDDDPYNIVYFRINSDGSLGKFYYNFS